MMRIVVFSPSIVSDIGNPQATTVRALCQALVDAGCDVTHLEERGNIHLTRMLTARGSTPMRAFNLAYPGIRYRQYEMLTGMQRSVWFGRELAIADALIVFPGVPDGVMAEATGFAVPQVVRFLPDLIEIDRMSADDVFADAVDVVADDDYQRAAGLTLIWDHALPATGRVICCGAETPGAAEYVAEVALGPILAEVARVSVSAEESVARQLLPVASGCVVTVQDANGARTISGVPDCYNARLRAERMVRGIVQELTRRMVRPAARI